MYLNVAVRICVYCYFNSCLSFCILQLWSDLQMTLLYPASKTEPFIHTNFSKLLLQCWLYKNKENNLILKKMLSSLIKIKNPKLQIFSLLINSQHIFLILLIINSLSCFLCKQIITFLITSINLSYKILYQFKKFHADCYCVYLCNSFRGIEK